MMSTGDDDDASTHGVGLDEPFSNPPLPISSLVVPLLETITVTVGEVPTLPAASKALETIVCGPLATLAVPKLNESDVELVLEVTSVPSISICICVTPTLSEAVAVTITVPETVAPFAGEVTEVVGGVVSIPGVVTFRAKSSTTNEVCKV